MASQLGLCHPSLILSDIIIIISAVMVAIIAFAVGFGRFLNKKPLITVGSGFLSLQILITRTAVTENAGENTAFI